MYVALQLNTWFKRKEIRYFERNLDTSSLCFSSFLVSSLHFTVIQIPVLFILAENFTDCPNFIPIFHPYFLILHLQCLYHQCFICCFFNCRSNGLASFDEPTIVLKKIIPSHFSSIEVLNSTAVELSVTLHILIHLASRYELRTISQQIF